MKKNKVMVLGMSAIALALILAFAGCTVPGEENTPSPAAAQLAAELNAIQPGSATSNGNVVTLTSTVWVQNNLTVPESVVLNLTTDDVNVRFNLQDGATLTVNGTVNARGHSEEIDWRGMISIDPGTIVINGNGTINLSSEGRILSIYGGHGQVSLTLDGVTLVGLDDNSESLVWVGEDNEFTSEFTMKSGAITGNNGGGVNVWNATFIMSGGTISGNNADIGGGVDVSKGTFTMSGGTISGNTADRFGGGVAVRDEAAFIMTGGVISGNAAGESGGGVVVAWEGATFTMEGGTIYGSSAAGGNANTAQENAAISVVEEATATWGTGGTYTKGGASQTGGSNIAGTDETLIAIPAPLFPENMLGNWDKDDDSSFIGFYNLMDRNPPDARIRPFNIADWILEDISGNIYTLSATNGGWRMDLKFTATIDTDGKLIISGAEEIAFGDNTISGFSYTEYSASDLNGTYTKQP